MTEDFDHRAQDLAGHYRHFQVAERLLFTGHSHQAWPDVALEGQKEAFTVAARDIDAKWSVAFSKTDVLRSYLRDYYDDPDGLYSFSSSTHDLIVRWLSSFDLTRKPRLITTNGEFHAITRQFRRLSEAGLEVVFLPTESREGFAKRLESALKTAETTAVCLSRVYFKTGLIQHELTEIAAICRAANVPLLIDDYHGTNVVPLSLRDADLEDCFLVSGGYKYLQWGEGNCFLRFPSDCALRPMITGWFASFGSLEEPQGNKPVAFDPGNNRFVGSTYDPTSQFRAAAVVAFFKAQGLTPEVLRSHGQAQLSHMKACFLELKLPAKTIQLMHTRPLAENGGFLALRSPHARTIKATLLEMGVYTDARDDSLRFGPAPYITKAQINSAFKQLGEVVEAL